MKKIRSLIESAVKLVQIIVSIVAGLTGFWILYSKLAVEHKATLPAAVDVPQRFVPTRGGKVGYYADTSAPGRPLVLVHSINAAASAFEMQPLFDFYRGKRPVYAVDLPGFGFSARDKRTYSPQLYAHSIYDFLDQALDEPADVVTLSLGGELAARSALMYPNVIRSIAMISPPGFTFKPREIPVRANAAGEARAPAALVPAMGPAALRPAGDAGQHPLVSCRRASWASRRRRWRTTPTPRRISPARSMRRCIS